MRNYFISAMLLMTALFIGCATDETTDTGTPGGTTGKYQTVYAHIKISNSNPTSGLSSTRAANTNDTVFEDGTTDENSVHNLLIVFYDQNGTPVGYYDQKGYTNTKDDNNSDDIESKLEWNDAEVVPIQMIRPGEPFHAIAFLNYDEDWKTDLTSKNKSDVSSIVKNTFTISVAKEGGAEETTKFFFMSNSGYFDGSGDFRVATEIKDFIYPTAAEAKSSPAITIYVERAAARVDFKIAEDAVKPYKVMHADEDYNLSFAPAHWGLTATENQNYLLKNMSGNLDSYKANTYPESFGDWVGYQRHRTFWAETPRYNSYVYPDSGVDTKEVSLTYLAHNGTTTEIAAGAEKFSTLYTFEHTFNAADFNTAENPYAVPTSLILDGGYKAVKVVNGVETEEELDFNGAGFYLRKIAATTQLYLEQNETGDNELFTTLLKEQTVIYTRTGAGTDEDPYVYTQVNLGGKDNFTLSNTHKFYYADGTEAESSNAWTIQLKNAVDTYYMRTYVPEKGNKGEDGYEAAKYVYTQVTEANLDAVNVALQKNVGSAFKYDSAKAYFHVPVLHYIASASYPDNAYTGTLAMDDDGNVINKTGELGVVRNHIYRLTVDNITGLGHGNPGDGVLIPDPEEEKLYYFHAKLEILSWHVVEFHFDLK